MTPDDHPTVSVLGTGSLGAAVALALIDGGTATTVWNRTAGRADPVVSAGARRARSAADAVAASTVVITALATHGDVVDVLGRAGDVLETTTVVNLASGSPDDARRTASWLHARGAAHLDGAAMSGTRLVGRPEALFLYSGDEAAFATAEPALGTLGRAELLGTDPGLASLHDTALLAMNMGVLVGFHHALALVRTAGIEPARFAELAIGYLPFLHVLIADGAAQIAADEYPGDDGTLSVFAAAMEHVLVTSRALDVPTDHAEAVTALLRRGIDAGHGDDGIGRLATILASRGDDIT